MSRAGLILNLRLHLRSPLFRQAHQRLEEWWYFGSFLMGEEAEGRLVWHQGFRYSAQGMHGMALFGDVWPLIRDLIKNTPGTSVTGPPPSFP